VASLSSIPAIFNNYVDLNFDMDTGCPKQGLLWVYFVTAGNAGSEVPDQFP
jgi:hypothetical protein